MDDADAVDPRSSKYLNRPNFNAALMTRNFSRFNARYGVLSYSFPRVHRLIEHIESVSPSSFKTEPSA